MTGDAASKLEKEVEEIQEGRRAGKQWRRDNNTIKMPSLNFTLEYFLLSSNR